MKEKESGPKNQFLGAYEKGQKVTQESLGGEASGITEWTSSKERIKEGKGKRESSKERENNYLVEGIAK